ncbi:hypothetical protein TNCV_2530821 [Trichonephila clavipes]|nr:hypothetical protein TNCV_2530821 [Trichonephila clavipes]
MRTRGDRDVYPIAPHTITRSDGMPMCVHHDAAKHGCDHLDDNSLQEAEVVVDFSPAHPRSMQIPVSSPKPNY